jgi:hypothetical protein
MSKRSICAVLAGVVFIIVITTLVDLVLHATRVFPPSPSRSTTPSHCLPRSTVSSCVWLTARLAPNQPMKHAMILGAVGVVLGFVGVVTTWNLGLGPRWYPIALVLLAIPQCWVGGKIYEMRSVSPASSRAP